LKLKFRNVGGCAGNKTFENLEKKPFGERTRTNNGLNHDARLMENQTPCHNNGRTALLSQLYQCPFMPRNVTRDSQERHSITGKDPRLCKAAATTDVQVCKSSFFPRIIADCMELPF